MTMTLLLRRHPTRPAAAEAALDLHYRFPGPAPAPAPAPAAAEEEGFDITKYSMTITLAVVFLLVKGLSSLGITIGPQ